MSSPQREGSSATEVAASDEVSRPGSFDEFYAKKFEGRDGFWIDRYPAYLGLYLNLLKQRMRQIRRAVGRCGRVLDIGCGAGDVLADLKDSCGPLVGMDIALSNASLTRRNLNRCRVVLPQVLAARGEGLPFRSESFDAVIMADVIEHVPEPRDVIREVYRVLRPGGKFVCVTPERNTIRLWEGLDCAFGFPNLSGGDHDVYERFLTFRELNQSVLAERFRIVSHDKVCFYPGPEGGGLFSRFLRLACSARVLREKLVEPLLRPIFDRVEDLRVLNQKQMIVGEKP